MEKGQIIKALSGFYYVKNRDGQEFQTRARGVFRKRKQTPLVGDFVHFDYTDDVSDGVLKELLPRNNQLDRPPVANVDVGVIITSAIEPSFSEQLLDRFLVMLEYKDIQPIIFITKMDLIDSVETEVIHQFKEDYEAIGYTVILSKDEKDLSKDDLENILVDKVKDKTVVFMGQSGAGKSTLLNKLDPTLQLKTAETSQALGRGKHTTRHVELVPLLEGQIADTPGFGLITFDKIEDSELSQCFPEMWERRMDCKFNGCLHNKEPKCAVKQAVEDGDIKSYRYKNYLTFLEEIQNRKPDYRSNR